MSVKRMIVVPGGVVPATAGSASSPMNSNTASTIGSWLGQSVAGSPATKRSLPSVSSPAARIESRRLGRPCRSSRSVGTCISGRSDSNSVPIAASISKRRALISPVSARFRISLISRCAATGPSGKSMLAQMRRAYDQSRRISAAQCGAAFVSVYGDQTTSRRSPAGRCAAYSTQAAVAMSAKSVKSDSPAASTTAAISADSAAGERSVTSRLEAPEPRRSNATSVVRDASASKNARPEANERYESMPTQWLDA